MKKIWMLLVILSLLLAGCAASGSRDMAMPADGGRRADILAPVQTELQRDQQITPEQAQQIALEYVQLTAEQVTDMRVRYDVDDAVPEYDVEFYYNGWEYEFEIHAQNGNILSFEKDD